jgi:hypothetical protein
LVEVVLAVLSIIPIVPQLDKLIPVDALVDLPAVWGFRLQEVLALVVELVATAVIVVEPTET